VLNRVCKPDNRPFLEAFSQKCCRNTDQPTRDLSGRLLDNVLFPAALRLVYCALIWRTQPPKECSFCCCSLICTYHSQTVGISTFHMRYNFTHRADGLCCTSTLFSNYMSCTSLRQDKISSHVSVYRRKVCWYLTRFNRKKSEVEGMLVYVWSKVGLSI
jgi:hypothetical protein